MKSLTKSKLIIVEGNSDVSLFKSLLINRNITDFEIVCPNNWNNQLEGEDAIPALLNGLPLAPGFDNLKTIIVVVDSDVNPQEKFNKFKQIIQNLPPISGRSDNYPVPTEPGRLANNTNSPSIAIVLLPSNTAQGAMETLCIEAAKEKALYPERCLDEFERCIDISSWLPQKKDKFRLRIYISHRMPKNPDIPLTRLWEVDPDIVPLNALAFDNLANYLASL